MTPEHTFTLWITALFTLPTIVFTGAVAYWTWRADQERIIVQKSPMHWETLDGTQSGATLSGVGIVVRNLSLFPVRIAGLGFFVDGTTSFPFSRADHESEWPIELASQARIVVYASGQEWARFEALAFHYRIMDPKLVAVAVTETGRRFFSNRLSVRVARRLRSFPLWAKEAGPL